MLWFFFGSGHWKREYDGVGAIAKRKLQKEQLRLNVAPFQNAQDVVKFLKEVVVKEYGGHANLVLMSCGSFGR
jgi:hypothetical protein